MMNSLIDRNEIVSKESVDPPMDADELLSRCLGRIELVDRVLTQFRHSLDSELDQLERSVREADTEDIARRAHRIKGTSLTISAHGLNQCAQRIEELATSENLEGIDSCLEALRHECTRLSDFIASQRGRTE